MERRGRSLPFGGQQIFSASPSPHLSPLILPVTIPTNPVMEASFAEAGTDIPLLIGGNLNEWSGFFPADPIAVTEELTSAIASAYPDKDGLTAEQIDTETIRLPLLKIMTHKAAQNGAPVYAYVNTYGNSYHGAEIPYVFNHVDTNTQERALAEQISQAWVNFAKTGVPQAQGLPTWEPYTLEGDATMILDTQSKVEYHNDRRLLSLLAPDYDLGGNGADITFPLGQQI